MNFCLFSFITIILSFFTAQQFALTQIQIFAFTPLGNPQMAWTSPRDFHCMCVASMIVSRLTTGAVLVSNDCGYLACVHSVSWVHWRTLKSLIINISLASLSWGLPSPPPGWRVDVVRYHSYICHYSQFILVQGAAHLRAAVPREESSSPWLPKLSNNHGYSTPESGHSCHIGSGILLLKLFLIWRIGKEGRHCIQNSTFD